MCTDEAILYDLMTVKRLHRKRKGIEGKNHHRKLTSDVRSSQFSISSLGEENEDLDEESIACYLLDDLPFAVVVEVVIEWNDAASFWGFKAGNEGK